MNLFLVSKDWGDLLEMELTFKPALHVVLFLGKLVVSSSILVVVSLCSLMYLH